jgi:ribose/xylose/arabinose/galactoside ABC-type transport system permease subunit
MRRPPESDYIENAETVETTASGRGSRGVWTRVFLVRDFGIAIVAVLIGLVFSLASPVFLSTYNLLNLLRQTAELGMVAMAMTMLIIAGEFDLSVGAIYAVTGVVTGLLAKHLGMETWAAAGCGLISALVLGLLNGLLVTTTKINSFIATLSTMMVYRGIAMVLSQGQPISSFLVEPEFFNIMGRGKAFGSIPVPIFWMIGWGVLLFFFLHRTAFGVKVYATGDNAEAATLAGINITRVKRAGFLLTSLAAGLAGLVSLGYLKTVTPTQGTGLELEAIAAAVIGGTSMAGGVGSIVGTFIGTFIMAEVRTGLVLLGTDAYIQDAFVGLVIALAVIVNIKLTDRGKFKG